MSIEYVGMLNGGMQEVWAGELRPLMETVIDSPYFWGGVALASLALIKFSKSLLK